MVVACIAVSCATIASGVGALFSLKARRLHAWLFAQNALVVVPLVVLLMMQSSGASPVAQLSRGTMDWWSLWFHFWPIAMLGLLGAIAAAFVCLLITTVDVVRARTRTQAAVRLSHTGLSVAQAVLMMFLIGSEFPDA